MAKMDSMAVRNGRAYGEGDVVINEADLLDISLGSAWCITADSAANTAQTLTKAAAEGKTHYIDGFSAVISAADAVTALSIEVKDGTTTIYKDFICAGQPKGTTKGIVFRRPVACTAGNSVSLVIAAGGASVVSTGNLFGVTK